MLECNATLEHTVGVVDYVNLLVCELNPTAAVIVTVLLLFIYFLTLSVAAESVFCPNLSTMAKLLSIPESLAGVSLAAFGNGAGDLFSVFVSFQSDLVPLALGELVGAALFVSLFVTGLISVIYPSKLSKQSITREIWFFLGALLLTNIAIYDGIISIWESLMLICYYVLYVCIVFYQSYKRETTRPTIEVEDQENVPFYLNTSIQSLQDSLGVNEFPSAVPSEISIEDSEFDDEYFQPNLHFRHSFTNHNLFRKGNQLWQRHSFHEPRTVAAEDIEPADDDILIYETAEIENPLETEIRTKAVQQLKARPAGGNDPSTWNFDQFAQTHWDYQSNNHGTPMFFPWHRMFVLQYEKALRSIDPSITQPYWDWTLDSQHPQASDIFHPQNFGGNGQNGNCVQDGVAAGWSSVVFKPACLKRCNSYSTFYSPEALTGIINQSQNFKALHNAIENGPHASVHNQIGGTCGDFGSMASAGDPIFFLHHAMVDKIWSKWQSACSSNVNNFEADPNSSMPPFNGAVNDVLATSNLCYSYSPSAGDLALTVSCPNGKSSNGIPAAAPVVDNHWAEEMLQALIVGVDSQRITFVGKRDLQLELVNEMSNNGYSLNENYTISAPAYNDLSDLIHLRHPAPIPDYHIKMMNMNETLVRQTELLAMKITDDYNNRDGYCSPAALKHFNTHNHLGMYHQ
ncbi:hypothetical protein HDV06_004470 [Boothiomyces sp. JEL0866]|nr:hypothetical protein HDV06_004470 [Boothiomyces sp. JEL0866]